MGHEDNFYEKLEEGIVLPQDEKLKKQLELKLKEYRERLHRNDIELARQGKNIAYIAPEVISGTTKDLNFKIKVLGKLLKDGHAVFSDFKQYVVNDENDTFLKNAFGVIKSYVEARGERVTGGTGLPEVEE